MSGTIEYFDDMVECENCGTENHVNCISTTDTKESETFNEVVAGQKCSECGEILKY